MGSLGPGELVVIAIVAIVVFGPTRLPEIARKASELLQKARSATESLTNAIDTEFDGVAAPLKELKSEYDETMQTIKKMAPSVANASLELPGGKPNDEASKAPTADETDKIVEDEPAADIENSAEATDEIPALDKDVAL